MGSGTSASLDVNENDFLDKTRVKQLLGENFNEELFNYHANELGQLRGDIYLRVLQAQTISSTESLQVLHDYDNVDGTTSGSDIEFCHSNAATAATASAGTSALEALTLALSECMLPKYEILCLDDESHGVALKIGQTMYKISSGRYIPGLSQKDVDTEFQGMDGLLV